MNGGTHNGTYHTKHIQILQHKPHAVREWLCHAYAVACGGGCGGVGDDDAREADVCEVISERMDDNEKISLYTVLIASHSLFL